MLEVLTQKLTTVFDKLKGKGKLTEGDIDEALRQVRLALLEADVNFKVVKEFLSQVKERALNAEVLGSLTSAQQVIKIVNEELIAILGKERSHLISAPSLPSIALMVGLQGSGKTTTGVKLAVWLRQEGQRPLLVAADTRRPAAIEQLKLLGKQQDIPVYSEAVTLDDSSEVMPTTICLHAVEKTKELAPTWVIVDTQGRLHIDEAMMAELADIKSALQPSEVLLTVDAMTGQEAVKIAQEFHSRIGLTGIVLTKMDGDARGGAALSIRSVTGVPIKFLGIGEKVDALEPFFPDRLASRILGMGDILSVIERVEKTIDQEQAKNLENKVRTTGFDLQDLLDQIGQIGKMGALGQLIESLGFSKLAPNLSDDDGEKRLRNMEAIILSMTHEERHNPAIINGSRRRRIARGSGTTPQDVNQLLNQFNQIRKMTKLAVRGKLPKNRMNIFGGWHHSK